MVGGAESMATSSTDLKQFTVASVEGLDEGKERGRGCYGAVYEVRLHGLPCIAKRLHDILVGRGKEEPVPEEQRRAMIGRFCEECVLLSGLRHPNVVQFMGIHYGRDEADISLIMEYVHMDLDHCMKTYPDIPLPYKTSILRDVAYGLAYLHSIPIIHRDLNAGNVLLTESLRAKIADLGVAKLFDKETVMIHTRTLCPGALDFMPPECLDESPKYNTKVDIFSFGHLTIYLANQKAPFLIDRSVTPADVQDKQMQVGKRRRSLTKMGGSDHPLYSIAVQCLSDTPDQRPTSRDLVRRMKELCKKQPLPYKNTLSELTAKDREIRANMNEFKAQLDAHEQKIEELKNELAASQAQNVQLKRAASNYQMESTRADRLQNELEHVTAQNRELEKINAQLKSSNQSPLEQAREAKARGNEYFEQKNKEAAIACYEEAVQLCPEESTGLLAICYHNIAACLESMANSEEDKSKKSSLFEQVVAKCTISLKYNPRYIKPLKRRMRACQALGRRREAFMDANRLSVIDDSNNNIPADLLSDLGTELACETFLKLEPQRPPKQYVLSHFLQYAWQDDLSIQSLRALWKSAHPLEPVETIKEEEEEGEIKQEEEDEVKEKEQKDQDNTEEQENQSDVEEQGDEETKEVVENGEAKEEGELSDNSDAPSPSKAPLKTEVTPTEELDVLFAKEPFVKAATMFSQNNFDTILGQLTAAIEKGHPVFRPHAFLLRGSFRYLWRLYQGALDDLQCVADIPDLPVELVAIARVKRAGILSTMAERELCDKELQLALKANKDQADIYITRAKSNIESENPEVLLGAQEDLKRALSLAPNSPLIYFYLGLVVHRTAMLYQNLQLAHSMQTGLNPRFMQMGEAVQLAKQAKEWFEQGYKKFPDCSEGLILYAMFLQDTQEVDRSEDLLHKAVQLEPDNGLAHVILSTVYLAQQEHEKAFKSLQTAITVDSSCIQGFELMASLEMQKGNQERALELHDVAIRNCRSFQELQQVLMTKEVVVAQRKACQEYGINPVSLFEERLSQLQASGGQF